MLVWYEDQKIKLPWVALRTVGRDAEWKRMNTVGTSLWPQLMFMDTYEASCGLIQRYREDWSAGLADAGGDLRHQSPPVDASQHSRPHEGPSPRFHRAQCWPVLALPPDLIEHSSLDCVPVLSLSLKKPSSFYFSSSGNVGIYLFGCVRCQLQHMGSSFLSKLQTWAPCIGSTES